MSYSNTHYDPDHPDRFPPPQTFLCWSEAQEYTYKEVDYNWTDHNGDVHTRKQRQVDKVLDTGRGKVRHKTTLADARKYCGYVARDDNNSHGVKKGAFWHDWKIFEWQDGQWVLIHEGRKGQLKKDHPLYARGVAKKLNDEAGPAAAEAYALSVIQASMQKAAS